jgi:hypothetical protein
VIKRACIEKHQRKVDVRLLTGTLKPDLGNPYGLSLELNVDNQSKNLIITRTRVLISIKQEGQPDYNLIGVSDEMWLLPHSTTETYLRFASPDAEQQWEAARKRLLSGAQWSWRYTEANGIRFVLN